MNKLHICIIGCGEITNNAHAPSLRKLKEKVRISFSSRDRKKAHEFCHKFGGDKAYQGIEEVLKDNDVDAVSISLPHDQHRDVAVAFAKAKKHLLVEKPFCCTVQEADEIIQAAKENKVKLAVAECLKYSRSVVKSKELLDKGEIGEFRAVMGNQLISVTPRDWRKSEKQMGGGALIDGGVHIINVLHSIAGPVQEVFAMQPPKSATTMEGEDTTFLLMKFANEGIGQIDYSWAFQGAANLPYFFIHGTEGSISNHNGLFLIKKETQPIPMEPNLSDSYDWMMEDFVDSILNDREPLMTGELGKQDISVALAAYESVKTGKPVRLL